MANGTHILLLLSLCALPLQAARHTLRVAVSNPSSQPRTDAPVVISLEPYRGTRAATVERNGSPLPCQLDDMDGDWRPDELVFLTDIGAHEKQTFTVSLLDHAAPADSTAKTPQRVFAHLSITSKPGTDISAFEVPGTSNVFNSLYHHGACFESELVGFRLYSDSRQNVDIYGKRRHQLELATTMFNSTARHLSQGYGHDVLWNGQSIACGTLRDWHDGQVQLVNDVIRRGQRILSYGPLRTVVELTDFGWHGTLCCRTRYTLYAGHRDVQVEAIFDEPLPSGQFFCTGVQKVGSTPQGQLRPDGIAASWGTDWPDYGKKDLYPQQAVGLAVFVPTEYVLRQVEDSLNYLVVLHAPGQTHFRYWLACCADMEEEGGCHSAQAWFDSLDRWRETLLSPLEINIQNQ